MLDWSLISGPLRVVLLVAGVLAVLALLLGRGRRWWSRRVPVAVVVGVVAAVVLMLVVNLWWRPFPDPLPMVVPVWFGLTVAALSLAVLRPSRWPTRVVALLAAGVVALSGAAQVNEHFGAYPTVRAALGVALPNQIDFSQIPGPTPRLVVAPPGMPLAQTWTEQAGQRGAGAVSTASIPGTTSGFSARPAWIYLPPAYLSTPRAQLPVLVLVSGQPGTPRDWFDGGKLGHVMDTFAAAHHGLAPVVVVADQLGSQLAHPLCMDSQLGNTFSYLSVDVPAWIRSHLQVDPNPRHWAVGGYSAGGTCALQLAVNAPTAYPTFVDVSGQDEPTLGTRSRTVAALFGGDTTAFTSVNPLDVLTTRRFPDTFGFVVVGHDDATYRPQAQTVVTATRAAGMHIEYLELPGGHSWNVWGPGLAGSLPWLARRTGLTG